MLSSDWTDDNRIIESLEIIKENSNDERDDVADASEPTNARKKKRTAGEKCVSLSRTAVLLVMVSSAMIVSFVARHLLKNDEEHDFEQQVCKPVSSIMPHRHDPVSYSHVVYTGSCCSFSLMPTNYVKSQPIMWLARTILSSSFLSSTHPLVLQTEKWYHMPQSLISRFSELKPDPRLGPVLSCFCHC